MAKYTSVFAEEIRKNDLIKNIDLEDEPSPVVFVRKIYSNRQGTPVVTSVHIVTANGWDAHYAPRDIVQKLDTAQVVECVPEQMELVAA